MAGAFLCLLVTMNKLVLLFCIWTPVVLAHAVHHDIGRADAVVVTLYYANGNPFASRQYALTPVGEKQPVQTGKTDAQGRIVFLPAAAPRWRLRVQATDGHGVNREIAIPPPLALSATAVLPDGCPPCATSGAQHAPAGRSLWLDAATGLALIFGLFGLYQMFLRRSR